MAIPKSLPAQSILLKLLYFTSMKVLRCGAVPCLCAVTRLHIAITLSEQAPASRRQWVVVIVLKLGNTTDSSNYRPLTLLPAIDKLLALLLAGRLAMMSPPRSGI